MTFQTQSDGLPTRIVRFLHIVSRGKSQLRELQLRGTLLGTAALSALAACFRAQQDTAAFHNFRLTFVCRCTSDGITSSFTQCACAISADQSASGSSVGQQRTRQHTVLAWPLLYGRGEDHLACPITILNVGSCNITGSGLAALLRGLLTNERSSVPSIYPATNCRWRRAHWPQSSKCTESMVVVLVRHRFSLATLLHIVACCTEGKRVIQCFGEVPLPSTCVRATQNMCGDASISSLSLLLEQNDALIKLHLQDNNIVEEGSCSPSEWTTKESLPSSVVDWRTVRACQHVDFKQRTELQQVLEETKPDLHWHHGPAMMGNAPSYYCTEPIGRTNVLLTSAPSSSSSSSVCLSCVANGSLLPLLQLPLFANGPLYSLCCFLRTNLLHV